MQNYVVVIETKIVGLISTSLLNKIIDSKNTQKSLSQMPPWSSTEAF